MDPGDHYVLGLKGLKWIGYQDYISLECGGPDDVDERKRTDCMCPIDSGPMGRGLVGLETEPAE